MHLMHIWWSKMTAGFGLKPAVNRPVLRDLICFSGEDLLGAPETDPWLPGLHRSAVIAGRGGMAPHGLSPGAVAV